MTIAYEVGERVRHLGSLRVGEVSEVSQRRGSAPVYTVQFGDGSGAERRGERQVEQVDLESAEIDLRGPEHEENAYSRHVSRERFGDAEPGDASSHPDGCYWCGSHFHPSDTCAEREEFYTE